MGTQALEESPGRYLVTGQVDPNLLAALTAWCAGQGLAAYVLGGGYEPGDGVYRHKRNFAPRGQLPFRVACLVHDEEAARELEAVRSSAGDGWAPREGYFPRYRS